MFPGILCTSVLVLGLYIAPLKSSEVYRCPAGLSGTMYTHSSHCYRYVDTTATWDAASEDCSSTNGGHLVVILDQSTQNFISSLPFSSNTYQIWIGFSDRSQEQHWKWVTGEAWSYDFWKTGYPELCFGGNDICPEDCAYMRTSDGRWREDHCNNNNVRYQYICQYDMGPLTTATTNPKTTTTKTTPVLSTKSTTTTTTTKALIISGKDTATTVLPVTTATLTTAGLPAITVTMTTESSTTTEPMVGGMGQFQDGDKALSTGGLIGLIIVMIIVILLILAVLVVIIRRRNRRKQYEAEDISVRFQNHTYNTNQLPNSFVDGQIGASNGIHSVENIYDTPRSKHCNGDLYQNKSYKKQFNHATLGHDRHNSHYELVKECDMVDLPGGSSKVDNPTYSSDQNEAGDQIFKSRSKDELLRYFEEYNKTPTRYDDNLYVVDKNKPL